MPQLSSERQRGGRDVGALLPAALGLRLPGRSLSADRGSEHHRDAERDYSTHQSDPHAVDDSPASHHSSTRWAPAQPASCTRSSACLAEPLFLPSVRRVPRRAALREHGCRSGSSWSGCGVAGVGPHPVGKGGRAAVGVRLFLTPKCPSPWCFINVPCNPQPHCRHGRGDVASFRGGSGVD